MDWTNHLTSFTYFQKKYPHSMRLNFFHHRTMFWTPNCQFFSNCVHFWWGGSTLAISEDKKIGLNEPLWTSFIYFQKKYPRSMRLNFFDHRTLFWSPNRQFQSNSAFWLAGSTLARVVDKIKKNGLNERLRKSFIYFQKKYPRSIRLNFFDHRTLFWSPGRQFQLNYAHCWWTGSTLAIIGD